MMKGGNWGIGENINGKGGLFKAGGEVPQW